MGWTWAEERALTCLWAYTTLPSSFHVPPRRSIRTIRRIWKKRRPRNALVANTWPDVPIPITIIDAPIVITSVDGRGGDRKRIKDYLQPVRNMWCSQWKCCIRGRLTYNTKRSLEEFQTAYAALVSWPTSWWPQSVPAAVRSHRNGIKT